MLLLVDSGTLDWPIIIFIIVVCFLVPKFNLKKVARNVLEQAGKIRLDSDSLGTREVYSFEEFSHVDIGYYDQKEEELSELGFRKAGDIEYANLSKNFPNLRTFVRCLTSEDGKISAAIYQMRPKGWKAKLQFATSGMQTKEVFEFESAFSEGTSINTTNAPSTSTALDYGIKFQMRTYPQIQIARELLEIHNKRVSEFMREHPEAGYVPITNIRELIEAGERQYKQKAAYRRYLGRIINRRELELSVGHKLTKREEKIYAIMKRMQEEEGYRVEEDDGRLMPEVLSDGETGAAEISQADSVEACQYQDLAAAIHQKSQKKPNWVSNMMLLIFSLVIFFNLGGLSWGWEAVILILVVLVVHEMGHYAGMKLFKYRNVKMFFIPLLGAAVAGEKRNVASWKEAVVILLGPLPGIIISIVLSIMYMLNKNDIYHKLASMFFFINIFNLLPFMPLDGGRFFKTVLFSRNRYVEAAFIIVGGIGLAVIGFAIDSRLLVIVGIIGFVSLSGEFKKNGVARRIREDIRDKHQISIEQLPVSPVDKEVPHGISRDVIDMVRTTFHTIQRTDALVNVILDVWERVRIKPPGVIATVFLIMLYLGGFFLSCVSCAGVVLGREGGLRSEIVSCADEDEETYYVEYRYLMGVLKTERELSDDCLLYHGKAYKYFFRGAVAAEGQFQEGYKDGEWKYYNRSSGELERKVLYDRGKVMWKETFQDGQSVMKTREELLEEVDEEELDQMSPKGPDEATLEEFEAGMTMEPNAEG